MGAAARVAETLVVESALKVSYRGACELVNAMQCRCVHVLLWPTHSASQVAAVSHYGARHYGSIHRSLATTP